MRKFKDSHLNEVHQNLILEGYDSDTAYAMVMELETDLSSRNTMDYQTILDITDKMLEEEAITSIRLDGDTYVVEEDATHSR